MQIKLNTLLRGLIVVSLVFLARPSSAAEALAFVINAHGSKTQRTFDLESVAASVVIYAPHDLANSYLYADDGRHSKGIEQIFRVAKLPGFASRSAASGWQRYALGRRAKVPDVDLTPLNFDSNLSAGETGTSRELKYFKENITRNVSHWAHDLGDDAILQVRRNGQLADVKGHAGIKAYMAAYDHAPARYDADNAPVLLFSPKHSKVKVLGKTSLGEIAMRLQGAFANEAGSTISVLMAACNESSPSDKVVVLSTDASAALSLSDARD